MPIVVADSGVENVQCRGRPLPTALSVGALAQVEVSFSNSMIELSGVLSHQWLYLHLLESFSQLEQLIDFYVKEHNAETPAQRVWRTHAGRDGNSAPC